MKSLFHIACLVCVSSLPISSLPERHLKPINQSLVGLRSSIKSAGIVVKSALYGTNCGTGSNQTSNLADACNSKQQCDYTINHNSIGDPSPGCPKTYTVEYQCSIGDQYDEVKSFTVSSEASGKIAHLSCSFLYTEIASLKDSTEERMDRQKKNIQQLERMQNRLLQVITHLSGCLVTSNRNPWGGEDMIWCVKNPPKWD